MLTFCWPENHTKMTMIFLAWSDEGQQPTWMTNATLFLPARKQHSWPRHLCLCLPFRLCFWTCLFAPGLGHWVLQGGFWRASWGEFVDPRVCWYLTSFNWWFLMERSSYFVDSTSWAPKTTVQVPLLGPLPPSSSSSWDFSMIWWSMIIYAPKFPILFYRVVYIKTYNMRLYSIPFYQLRCDLEPSGNSC